MLGLQLPFLLLWASTLPAAIAIQRLQIKAWPFDFPSPLDFATIHYDPSTYIATVEAYEPLNPPAKSRYPFVRLGFYTSESKTEASWSGISVPLTNFETAKNKTLRLLTTEQGGQIQHLSFLGTDPVAVKDADAKTKAKAKAKKKKTDKAVEDTLALEVVHPVPGPLPVYNKPIVLNKDGQLDNKPPEKSFLQKYWWAIGLFLLVQVVIGGGGGDDGKK